MVTTVAIDDRRASSPRQLRLLQPAPAITTSVDGPLIERDAELDVMHDAVCGLSKGTGRVVVVDGAAGLGKSALLDQAAVIAKRAGCMIRRATPGPHERGAQLLAGRARRELVATGMRPRRAALEGVAALTPRQRQICELAAAGKGNKAISRELFLSIKTVETHLAAAYRKLGVSTRTSLQPVLAGSPPAFSRGPGEKVR